MIKKSYFILFSLIITINSFAQESNIGAWKDYLSYSSVIDIATSDEYIFGATTSGIIVANKNDNSFSTISKSNGLTETQLSCIGYNTISSSLLVGYHNGKLDLIKDDRVIAIVDIFNKPIPADKRINSLYMVDQYAYLSTGFGIVKYDTEREEFVDTYVVSSDGSFLSVNEVTIFEDTIYAATNLGIRKASVTDPELGYYGSWELDNGLLNALEAYQSIKSNDENVFTILASDSTDVLYELSNGQWNEVVGLQSSDIIDLDLTNERISISHEGFISSYDSNWLEIDRIFNYGEGKFITCNKVKILGETQVISGDNEFGLVDIPRPFMYHIYKPKSIPYNDFENFTVYKNQIIVAAGGRLPNYNNVFSNKGVYFRDANLNWKEVNKWEYSLLDGVFDFMSVIINKSNPSQTFGGSLGGGLIEFENGVPVQKYNHTNSTLQVAESTTDWVGVTGMAYDNSGNLWVANSRNPQCISVLTPEGVYANRWYGFNFPGLISADLTHDIIVDKQNYKWLVLPYGGKGILVFNDNNTIDDTSDDEYKILNSVAGNGGLPSNDVYCLAEDQDGEIWVGTAKGVAVFYAPGSVFAEGANFDAQQIIVEADGYFEYLLSTETVTSIAIDGANRKWIGTAGSGVFLMSAEGTTELYHFTAENSPLLSNNVKKVSINHSNGEVLIGTSNGIISFKAGATGDEIVGDAPYAYPNPVPSNYDGMIGIKGLPANSPVKITDIAGNLVFETISEGTQAVWDGRDMNGNKVATGIYLVMGTAEQGADSKVVKIMISE